MLKNKYLLLYIFSLSLLFSEKFEYLNGKEKIEYKKSEKKKKELHDFYLINYSEPESWYLLSGIGFSTNQYYSYPRGASEYGIYQWKTLRSDSYHPSINLGFYWHLPKSKAIITEQKTIKSPKKINEKVLVGFNLEYNQIPEWDSIGHMTLISGLEESFKITIDTDDIIDFSSYEKGKEILTKLANLEDKAEEAMYNARLKQVQKGYVNESNAWVTEAENPNHDGVFSNRLDSRGDYKFQPGWVWAIGKSFKAGNMNIPVNLYAIPDNDGWLYGFSFGYALHK